MVRVPSSISGRSLVTTAQVSGQDGAVNPGAACGSSGRVR